MTTNKAHRIRLKISGGIDHIQKFYEAVEKFAKFESFETLQIFLLSHKIFGCDLYPPKFLDVCGVLCWWS